MKIRTAEQILNSSQTFEKVTDIQFIGNTNTAMNLLSLLNIRSS